MLIVCATLFLVVLFVARNGIPFREKTALQKFKEENGLTYGDATVASLIENDTDGDGVLDWEEALWGLDPTTSETTPGTPDGTVAAKLKAAYEPGNTEASSESNLTETDKFSRELLSTLVALNQNGTIDDATIETISSSLVEHLKTSGQNKVYALSDLNITTDESQASYKKFNDALEGIDRKIPINGNISAILDSFVEGDTVNPEVLSEFDPVIKQIGARITEALQIPVPESLAATYLQFLNASQGLSENLEDLKLFETDPIITLGAISQYEQNITLLAETAIALTGKVNQKLGF